MQRHSPRSSHDTALNLGKLTANRQPQINIEQYLQVQRQLQSGPPIAVGFPVAIRAAPQRAALFCEGFDVRFVEQRPWRLHHVGA